MGGTGPSPGPTLAPPEHFLLFYLTGVLAPYIFLFGWVIGIQVVFLAFSLIILIFSTLFGFLSKKVFASTNS